MIAIKIKQCLASLTAIIAVGTMAQPHGIHWPQDGDRVVKTQYEFVAVEADSAVWDFSHAVETGREHAMRWLNLGDTVLVRVEQGHQFTYRMQGDTLLWLGYENPLLGMRDSIAPVAKMPMMTLGDSVATPYYFHGKYSGNHAVDMTGIHVVQKKALARSMTMLGFHNELIMGEGDIKNNVQNQDSVKEDLFEAIVGAVTLDCNWDMDKVTSVVEQMIDFESFFQNEIDLYENYVGKVQQWFQSKLPMPNTAE